MSDVLQAAVELKPILKAIQAAQAGQATASAQTTGNALLTDIKALLTTTNSLLTDIKARLPAALDASGGLKVKEQ